MNNEKAIEYANKEPESKMFLKVLQAYEEGYDKGKIDGVKLNWLVHGMFGAIALMVLLVLVHFFSGGKIFMP